MSSLLNRLHGPPKKNKRLRRDGLKGLLPYIRAVGAVVAAAHDGYSRLGSYLRDVLKVLAIHRNFPTRFDRHSINTLCAGSPSNRCCRSGRSALTDQAVTVSSGFQRARSKAIPLARTAHAVRAILLANATTTTL